jgi:AraC family transcriptional regulator
MCRPLTTSFFEVEHHVEVNGIYADIRSFGWEHSCTGRFQAESYYVDYSLTPRPIQSKLLHTGHRWTPDPGDIVFLPKDSEFDAECAPCEQRLLCLTFEREAVMNLFEGDGRGADLSPCFDVQAPRVRQTLARIAEEVREPGFGWDVLTESLSLMTVVELSRHLQERQLADETPRGRIADWRLRRLKERVEDGLAGQLSITDLAAECGMSPRHLIRTFKNTVGITLSDYIAEARIRRAKRELAAEDALIKIVAHNCGFQSAAAFSASFRKATGMSPREFRQDQFRFAA